jgi:hypothetical protein
MNYLTRFRESRPLTLIERTMVAVTVWVAVATMLLAISQSARASEPAGALPAESAATWAPQSAISHVEYVPQGE